MYREVETMRKEVLGEKHADTLTSTNWNESCLYNK